MSQEKSTEPDKGRQSRYGPFLVFLFVLIIVLVVVGGGSVNQPEVLSQDEYLYQLHSGTVASQEFRGTSEGSTVIEGEFQRPSDPDPKLFRVEFADAASREDEFREVKARKYQSVDPDGLRQGLAGGYYTVTRGTSITTFSEFHEPQLPPRRPGERLETEQTEDIVHQRPADRLFVEVVAKSADSWQGLAQPDFPLPKESGHVWLDVRLDDEDDLGSLLGVVTAGGTPLERLNLELTKDKGTTFSDASTWVGTFLLMIGPWLLILFFLLFFMRQLRSQGGAGGVMNFGRSRAQMYTKENRTNITFDDVAGAEEAKSEVREIVEFLKNPGRFQRIGGRIPRGVLLNGPPGCGKTLLAKAIAGEAEVPFFSISGSDFVEMFVGVGASRVRDLFKQARENSPCIIFLDEIDAVGRRRGSGMGGGHDEREQTLNAILVEMDGFATDEGLIIVAATNRPDVLDPALLRPGRFDREVTIDLPDYEGRFAILEVHLKKVQHEQDVSVGVLARSTPGYSGADLAAIVNEAAIMAVLDKREQVSLEDLEEARDKVRYGRQKISRTMEEEDRKVTAYHEAGHAVVASVLEDTDPPHKVTIVPRGRALGATMILPEKESYHTQRKRLRAQLAMLFGGRIAEAEFCGDISAGASDDIRRATELARAMVTELGMSDAIGPINYADRQGSDFLGTELGRGKNHSEETAREIDHEVRAILDAAYAEAEAAIRANAGAMHALAQALLRFETISGREVIQLVEGVSVDNLRPEPEPEPIDTGKAAQPSTPTPEKARDEGERGGEMTGTPGLSPA
ncbi:ATP-dependent metallopeptidase FtsH/Yme1/Tma family protein [Engelhardtia mirabilis]|uniref:ATP-dependent zinc metalloprotease FtsH n=1 Tax=Engelhardtia mirabilis TaxID=2528011 RepID=A0A518BNG0_9BACT|nr:ATP-dependent zinc metalloprotease FtsH [Planctomycetes bacterium Pla133]QDV02843.1 ATP-dependent zinc metalloprotease FtsH [Planctomycetes bacterium Pla86]